MWRAAPDSEGVTGYQVFQGDHLVRELPADKTMVDVTGLAPVTSYTFTVRARDAAGNRSALSEPARATTPAAKAEDRRAPSAPPTTTGRAEGPRAARLSWTAATDDTGVTAYDVHQGGVRVHTAGAGESATTVTGLQPGTRYSFTVRARDGADNTSPDGPTVELTTPPDPGQGPDTAPGGLTATASPGWSTCHGPPRPPVAAPTSTSSTSTTGPSPSSSSGPARRSRPAPEGWSTGSR